jgi:hypothetical protein
MFFSGWKGQADLQYKSPFDISAQWKEPFVLLVILLFLGFFSALVIDGFFFNPPTVVSILAVDISESAVNSDLFPANEICSQQRLFLLPGDEQIDIWFADRSSLIGIQQVTRSRQRPECNLPPSDEDLKAHKLGQIPGTSLRSAVQLLYLEAQKRRSFSSNLPIVVVIALHELEPGFVEESATSTLEEAFHGLAGVVDEILLIGPKGELARELHQLSFGIEGLEFCPFRNTEDIGFCLKRTFAKSRGN